MMGVTPLLNSLHPLLTWWAVVTPSTYNCINQLWIWRMHSLCLKEIYHTTKVPARQCFQYHYHCTSTYPTNSITDWLSHHLLHVTSTKVSTSYDKTEGFFNIKITVVGTLLTEQASYIDCSWVTRFMNILTPLSDGP
jgi:hypothetical protein